MTRFHFRRGRGGFWLKAALAAALTRSGRSAVLQGRPAGVDAQGLRPGLDPGGGGRPPSAHPRAQGACRARPGDGLRAGDGRSSDAAVVGAVLGRPRQRGPAAADRPRARCLALVAAARLPCRGRDPQTAARPGSAVQDQAGREAQKLTTWAGLLVLPLGGGAVFLGLFTLANPVISQGSEPTPTARVGPWRLIFWLATLTMVWTASRPTLKRRQKAAATRRPPRPINVPAASITLSLVLFNALFAVQNGLDIAFLWSGAGLPQGVTLAEYAHRGRLSADRHRPARGPVRARRPGPWHSQRRPAPGAKARGRLGRTERLPGCASKASCGRRTISTPIGFPIPGPFFVSADARQIAGVSSNAAMMRLRRRTNPGRCARLRQASTRL